MRSFILALVACAILVSSANAIDARGRRLHYQRKGSPTAQLTACGHVDIYYGPAPQYAPCYNYYNPYNYNPYSPYPSYQFNYNSDHGHGRHHGGGKHCK